MRNKEKDRKPVILDPELPVYIRQALAVAVAVFRRISDNPLDKNEMHGLIARDRKTCGGHKNER